LTLFTTDGSPNPDVIAIGDAAKIKTTPLPSTAQVAYQKAKYTFKRLNKIVKDQEYPKPF